MAIEKWVTVGEKKCELIGLDVELREQRVYPSDDFLFEFSQLYRLRNCVCSAALDCNLAGIPCKWAYNAPDTDRF